jgi:hypothetical protein
MVHPVASLAAVAGKRRANNPPAGRAGAKGKKMIIWRFAVPAILVAAAVAGGVTYFATLALPQLIEAGQRASTTAPKATDRPDSVVSKNVQPARYGR